MSGPKGYSYVVGSPEELARRALRDALNRCGNLRQRLDLANQDLVDRGGASVEVRTESPTSVIQAQKYESELQRGITEAERRARVEAHRWALTAVKDLPLAQTLNLGPEFEEIFGKQVTTAEPTDESSARNGAPRESNEESDLTKRLVSVLTVVSQLEEASAREELNALIEQLQNQPVEQRRSRAQELVVRANQAVRDQSNRDALRRRAENLVCGFKFPYSHFDREGVGQLIYGVVQHHASMIGAVREELSGTSFQQYWDPSTEATTSAIVLMSHLG